jgi:sporulation protein YlmC with PRC-barrel domain
MQLTPHLVSTKQLDAYSVVNTAGEGLGQVQDFMLDMATGQVVYAIVSFAGTLGLTDKWFAIPWEAMTWSPETRHLVLNVSKEMLRQAPGLDKRHWQEQLNMKWLGQSSEYFGFPATWYNQEVPETPIIGTERPIRKY